MDHFRAMRLHSVIIVVLLALTPKAFAVNVADITFLQGNQRNILVGHWNG